MSVVGHSMHSSLKKSAARHRQRISHIVTPSGGTTNLPAQVGEILQICTISRASGLTRVETRLASAAQEAVVARKASVIATLNRNALARGHVTVMRELI